MHKKHGFLDSIQVNEDLRQRGQRLHPEDRQDGTWIKDANYDFQRCSRHYEFVVIDDLIMRE